jgi:hypothetical protein
MPIRDRCSSLVAAVVASLVLAPAAGAGQEPEDDHHHDHEHPAPAVGERVGVLLADHGEPPEYNELTYWSFRDFVDGLLRTGVIPPYLRAIDNGTVLWDESCPRCDQPSAAPRLIDAWLHPHDGPAAFVPGSSTVASHYVKPGGPGLGEPDVFEHAGLQSWDEWTRMGGRSPNYDEKVPRTKALISALRAEYGARIAIRAGYMIDPRIGGGRQGIPQAVDALVNRDRVEQIVVAYLGVGFSDIMQTHHLRHHIAETLDQLGAGDMPVRYSKSFGRTRHYVRAIVKKVQAELDRVPSGAPVAVHLSGHGLPTGQCGNYDCGGDAYHESARLLYETVSAAVRARVERSGRWDVFHIYGEGAAPEDDPEDKVDSPLEALAKRKAEGFTHVVDVPYEFDANSRDTLIVLREGYGREAPDWAPDLTSEFEHDGLKVRIANSTGGNARKVAARLEIVRRALDGVGMDRKVVVR